MTSQENMDIMIKHLSNASFKAKLSLKTDHRRRKTIKNAQMGINKRKRQHPEKSRVQMDNINMQMTRNCTLGTLTLHSQARKLN